ncbi:MAG: N-acetylmuramoyl-L-alanine amidase [Xanthobacteraceae bacterium]
MSFRAVSLLVSGALSLLTTLADARAAERPHAPVASDVESEFPVASDVRLGGDDNQTRMVVDFSRNIEVRTFTLPNPYRVVIDMPQVSFQLRPRTGELGRGLIKAFRFGLVMQGGSRMVIDLARPARVENAVVLEAENDQPARLVLDLAATDRETFMRAVSLDSRIPETPRPDLGPGNRQTGDPRPLIMLDPGHGGIDNGTRAPSTGEMEKTIVLEFSLLLRDKLEKTGKYRVAMTRTDDTFVPLDDRVALARSHQAALMMSIHADALRRREGDAQGATIYTLSERPSDARAARLAESENQADAIAGLDLSSEPKDVAGILVDLARRETKTFSVQFAQAAVAELKKSARLHPTPMRSAGFRVLKAPDVPSVLLELGYVTNKADLQSLISVEWRERTADSIVSAIHAFFRTRLAGNGKN